MSEKRHVYERFHTMWMMNFIIVLLLVLVGLTERTHAENTAVVNGQVKSIKRNSCQLNCKLPNFLQVLCNPLIPHLHCKKSSVEKTIKKLTQVENTIKCYCMWHAVLRDGRVDKSVFAQMVDYTPYNKTKQLRVRLSTLGRECQAFNDQLCVGRLKDTREGLFSKNDGLRALLEKEQKQSKKEKDNGITLSDQEEIIMWFGVAGGAIVFIICIFFVIRLNKDSSAKTTKYDKGSLDVDGGLSRDKRDTCCDSFMDKLRRNSRTSLAEKEKLLQQRVIIQKNPIPQPHSYPSEKKKEKRKSDRKQIAEDGTNSKSTQCGTVDFDVSLTSFSVSTEDARTKTLTGMKMAESESDGEEARMFHSSLMYGNNDTPDKTRNRVKSSSSLVSN
ncbi:uncharacterized protein LOC127730581 [Mytilus californianus]|uniref:uncharacterized protein LOC127730581 n=1 Tax=Mytilus californianus TaxID=6549 RepID=UPI002247993D|nr:uncharacterized protein LOC127730581 [Mytilus californianus]